MANKFEDMTFDNNDYQVVKKFNAKSRSVIIDMLIEKSEL